MKKNVVNASIEVMQSVTENKKTKGFKPVNSKTVTSVQPSKTETKAAFIAFIRSREEIGLNKFFKLLAEFEANDPKGYGAFLASYNLDFATDYNFKWFSENCPSMEIDGKKEFAKWVRVSDYNPLNANSAYNREVRKGDTSILYTLKPYHCVRANWEQYLSMFMDVIREIKRKKREQEKARKDAEKAANAEKAEKAKLERIAKLQEELAKLTAA